MPGNPNKFAIPAEINCGDDHSFIYLFFCPHPILLAKSIIPAEDRTKTFFWSLKGDDFELGAKFSRD